MTWLWFSLLSLFSGSLVSPLRKDLSSKISPLAILWIPGFLAIPIYIYLIFSEGLPTLNSLFGWYLLGTILIEIVSNLLLIYALKIEELSVVIPMLSLSSVFAYFLNILFLNSPFQLVGFIGVLLVVLGSVFAHAKFNKQGVNISFSFGSMVAILVALMWGFGSLGFILGIRNSNLLGFVSAVNLVVTVIILVLDIIILNNPFPKKTIFSLEGLSLTLLSFLAWVGEFSAAILISQPAYVTAVKRLDSLLNIIYGKVLWKEEHFKQKILGGVVMVVGILLIIFYR